MKKLLLLSLSLSSLLAFDGDPWVIEPLKPDLKVLYAFSFFSKVHGYAPHFINQQLLVGLDVAFPNHFQLSLELDQDASTFRNFYFRDAAIEIKKQFSDDVAEGDSFSVATGIRGVAQTALGRLDPATLYPGGYHFEGFISLGKEWSFQADHYTRIWVLGGLGLATQSSLWAEFAGHILYRCMHHELKISAESNLGYGAATRVDINDFQGWGHTRYRYLDVGLNYGYEVSTDLFLKAGFYKRVLCKVMPRNYNHFTLVLEKVF